MSSTTKTKWFYVVTLLLLLVACENPRDVHTQNIRDCMDGYPGDPCAYYRCAAQEYASTGVGNDFVEQFNACWKGNQ